MPIGSCKKTLISLLAASLFFGGVPPAYAAGEEQSPYWLGGMKPKAPPARIVSLAPSITEILFELGQGKRLVGVTRFDDYPPEVRDLPKVGGFVDFSVEAIAALSPDAVLCTPNLAGRQRLEPLLKLGIPVLVVPSYTLEQIYVAIETVGHLTGVPDRASELVGRIRSCLDTVARKTEGMQRPSALFVYGHRPLVAAGPGTFADRLLELAGGRNVLEGSSSRYPSLPLERVNQLSPEVILDASMGGEKCGEGGAGFSWSKLRGVPAVKKGRIYCLDESLWFRPGPRVCEAVKRLASLLHSDGTPGKEKAAAGGEKE